MSDWKYKQLWEGCILASIAHAIMVEQFPFLSNEHSWDDINYNVQDSNGIRGTVTFVENKLVAAFRNDNRISSDIEALKYFQGAPKDIIKIAKEETLQYLLEEVNGTVVPLITTAIWGDETGLLSINTSEELYENGGGILKRQLMDTNSAIQSWKEYYEMNEEQVNLLENLYQRKLLNPDKIIYLSDSEIRMIGIDDEEGLFESKESFNELNIVLEI
ncbi:hypothetical protein A8L44_12605 [Bacillus sp. FJAT-27986]|nr:hypothetical protein A8L44_12605 [Bacillus sp. FJAT-27986]